MISRRPLLLSLLASAALPRVAACAAQPEQVVVIGAGIAGLGAAAALRAAGYRVVIVEARSRIGGRVHTSRLWPDLPVDLGASWIHGVSGNPLSELASQCGARLVKTEYDSSLLHIDPALAALGARDSGEDQALALFKQAMAWAERQDSDQSIEAALNAVAPPGSLSAVRHAQLAALVDSRYEQEYAGSAKAMSAWSIDDNEMLPGGDALFPDGYDQIAAHLARGLDIRLGRTVKAVRRQGSGAVIAFADGATMAADKVIVTLPLGVLKSGAVTFDPPLPPPKQQAIARIGMGLLNKLWLRFDRVFWPAHYDWHEYLSLQKGYWSEWVSLARLGSPVLLAFSAADRADALESASDADIVAQAMGAAKAMFGTSIPSPVGYQITRWRSDPLARGSYSFNAVGSTNADRRALASSDDGVIHFAGEATSAPYPGTVHGALLSGRKAAAEIIRNRNHG